jgi:hypothetical protein
LALIDRGAVGLGMGKLAAGTLEHNTTYLFLKDVLQSEDLFQKCKIFPNLHQSKSKYISDGLFLHSLS